MNTQLFVNISVVVVSLIAVIAPALAVARLQKRLSIPGNLAWPVGIVLGAELIVIAGLALAGAFQSAATQPPTLGIAVLAVLVSLGLGAFAAPGLRKLLADPAAQPVLIALQTWRLEGLAFLILLALGQLPALFAIPAGVGDVLVGATAWFVARNFNRPGGRWLAVAWNLLGMLDLIDANFLGVTTNIGRLQLFHTTPTSLVVTAFPLVLIPAFIVPLSFVMHLVSLRYLFSTSASRQPAHGQKAVISNQ